MRNPITVIDNLLPEHIVSEIDYHIWDKYEFKGGHSSKGFVEGDHTFLSGDMFKLGGQYYHIDNDPVFDYLLDIAKISFSFSIKKIERRYINFHPVNHSGGWHIDSPTIADNVYTLLYMNSSQLRNKGNFQIKVDDEISEIEYVPGRFVMFKSNLYHRGLGCDQFRTTLAYKCIEIDEN